MQVKIVLPHWFDDCLKLGRKIDEKPYQHPNPEIERVDSAADIPMPVNLDLSYTHAHEGGPMNLSPPIPPRDRNNIFHGKRVILGDDLNISERLRKVLENIITQSQGVNTDNILEADVYVGQWREGSDYIKASRRAAYVGNLTWLYWMFAHGKWTSPLSRLLHYPMVKGGIPGMQDMVCVLHLS